MTEAHEQHSVWHFDIHDLEIRFRDKVIKVRQPYPLDTKKVDPSSFNAQLTVRQPLLKLPNGAHQKLAQPALVLEIDEDYPDE